MFEILFSVLFVVVFGYGFVKIRKEEKKAWNDIYKAMGLH